MTFAGLLPHQLRVFRLREGLDAQPARDRFGQIDSKISEMKEQPNAYPCRMTTASGGERNGERMSEVYVTQHRVYLQPGADVREDDRVKVIDPADGNIILPDGNVKLVRRVYGAQKLHHLELVVEVYRGPIHG